MSHLPASPASPARAEAYLVIAVVVLLALALALPPVALPAHYHHFADQRALAGLSCAADVLSNLAFALVGAAGLWALRRAGVAWRATWVALAGVFFVGLLATAVGSWVYHLQPDDAGLVLDRAAMAVAFAGLLGLVAALRVSDRAGLALAAAAGVAAAVALILSRHASDHGPWAVLQAGGLLVLAGLAARATRDRLPVLPVLPVLGLYALAKALELGDHTLFGWTDGMVSGHTLKHLVAAAAAWPVVVALRHAPADRPPTEGGQNVPRAAEPEPRTAPV